MSEESLFLAFHCSTQILPWDRAYEIGAMYMEKYPAGEWYDDLTLTMGQLYSKQEDWPNVIKHLTKSLEVSPKHKQAPECLFLLGYASFMEEKFEDTITWLDRMNRTYPGNAREMDGVYWLGMANLFEKKFDDAARQFDMSLRNYPNSPYLVDAQFRRAVCDFGNSKFDTAELRLKRFVTDYPTNKLAGEAYMMLGDAAGARADLPHAVDYLEQVPRYDVNIEFYNYASFRGGEMLDEMHDNKRVIDHFKEYIQRNREGSNVPLAMYWIGRAMWNMGEQRGALEYFRQGVEKYGVNRKALGIDLILENWIGQAHNADKSVNAAAWQDLSDMLAKAEREHQATLALRLKRVLIFDPLAVEDKKKRLLSEIMHEENITNASPGVLELMMEESKKSGNQEFATKVAETIVKDFTETDYALAARMTLAQYAIAKKDYETAIKHLGVVREVYATTAEAAESLLMLGDVYVKLGKYTDADECYKNVLSVKEWKGPLWPAALYGRGECARMQRKFDQASAYYERIYVMYGTYKPWAAKAYLARADCLSRLQMYVQATETLQEMISMKDLKEYPEYAEGQQRLNSLESNKK